MQQRFSRALVPVAALVLCACSVPGASDGGTADPPNLLLISIDTLRADHVGLYGHDAPTTPNLDALGGRGAVFLDHYAQAPNTAPSQTSVFTSLYPSVHGVWNHGEVLDEEVPVLAEMLLDAGYATGAFSQLAGESYRRGFETYERLRQLRDEQREERNLREIGRWLDGRGDRPFFLFLHSYEVHAPYRPRSPWRERFAGGYEGALGPSVGETDLQAVNRGEQELTTDDLAYVRGLYDAEIAHFDDFLGAVFGQLEDRGLLSDTVVAVYSDHGEEFGDHGAVGLHSHTLYQELIRTPLILAGPSVTQGARVTARSRNVDIAPTLLVLAGIEPTSGLEGSDLAPLMMDEQDTPRVALAEMPGRRALIVDELKLLLNESGPDRLFDLAADPGELRPLDPLDHPRGPELLALAGGWDEQLAIDRERVRQPTEIRLTDEERRRLRALGYIQ